MKSQNTVSRSVREYIRGLFYFPMHWLHAWRVFGWKGGYLAICHDILKGVPFPIWIAPFGRVSSLYEVFNLMDNFSLKELRNEELEKIIRQEKEPIIVDIGINVGLTVRWWFGLNPNAYVYGIDMLQEALDFTTEVVKELHLGEHWIPECMGVGDRTDEIEIHINDPLEGTNQIGETAGKFNRKIKIKQLDDILLPRNLTRIDLLKIDIEGYGGTALAGATEILKKTRYVVIELHNQEETVKASKALATAGLTQFAVKGRTMWWSSIYS
jgi:FkbM family methyltransferase